VSESLGSINIKCGYCDKVASQKVVAQYVQTIGQVYELGGEGFYDQQDWTLRLSLCESCEVVNYSVEDDGAEVTVLYPKSSTEFQGLPENVAKAYKAARAVRLIDANAFAVLLGRALELVCLDRKANGKTLHAQLEDLSKRGEIPGPLADMANQLRILRNIGAHAGLGELTKSEVPILDDLCKAILEYVYVAPNRVAKVSQRIENLKNHGKT
jgi:Domain of unknown function (DUF4145)